MNPADVPEWMAIPKLTISGMAMPYKKWLLEDEKSGMGSFNQRDPVEARECPPHMKAIKK
jgi:hypothetical protein